MKLFNSFWTSKWSVLFLVTFLLRLDSLPSKSVFVTKFACANLALKALPAKVKRLLKIIVLAYIYQLAMFGDFMICDSKDIFKNAPYLMY